jgi:hypothetical protein
MPPAAPRRPLFEALVFGGALLTVVALAVWWRVGASRARPASGPPVVDLPHSFAPGEPPRLLEPPVDAGSRPPLARERLLAADGSPREDLDALTDLVKGYLQAGLGDTARSLGFNEDLAVALTDVAALGESALPPDHPALRDGRVIDRWGTPWQVHPVASGVVELRSAGPDRRLYTPDDIGPVSF